MWIRKGFAGGHRILGAPERLGQPAEINQRVLQFDQDLDSQPQIAAHLGECPIQQAGSLEIAVVVQPHDRQQAQRLRPERAGCQQFDCFLERRSGPGGVAGVEVVARQPDPALGSVSAEPNREREQFGRCRGRTPGPRQQGGVVERCEGFGVGTDRREGQVARS